MLTINAASKPRNIVVTLAIAITLIVGAFASSAMADKIVRVTKFRDEIAQRHRLDYNVGRCGSGWARGANAYQVTSSSVRWTRLSGWNGNVVKNARGRIGETGTWDCAGNSVHRAVNQTPSGGGQVSWGVWYTRNVSGWPYAVVSEFAAIGAIMRADVYRGSTKLRTLCTDPYVYPAEVC